MLCSQVTDVKQKKGNTPVSSSTAKKTPINDPLSFSDPLGGGISTEFEGSDPLSLMMGAAPPATLPSKSARSSSFKASIYFIF